MTEQYPIDRNGHIVTVGSRVKLIELEEEFLIRLDLVSKQQLLSMIDQEFEVYEIDEYGQPWIEKEWHLENGQTTTHTLSPLPHQMELC